MDISKNNVLDIVEALKKANRRDKRKKPKITFELVKVGENNGFSRQEKLILVYGAETLQDVKMPKGWKLADITVKCRGVDSPIIVNNPSNRYRSYICINLIQDVGHLSEFNKMEPVK